MKSIFHRQHQLSKGQWRKISRRERRPASTVEQIPSHLDPDFLEGFARFMVGLLLDDTPTYLARRAVWIKYTNGLLPPVELPRVAVEYEKVFQSVHHKFKRRLEPLGEDDPWASYSLSYMALRRCAHRIKPLTFAYIYRACENAHKKILARTRPREFSAELAYAPRQAPGPEAIDLKMDVESALDKLPPRDATICRMKIEGDLIFQEIGAALDIDESTAQR